MRTQGVAMGFSGSRVYMPHRPMREDGWLVGKRVDAGIGVVGLGGGGGAGGVVCGFEAL